MDQQELKEVGAMIKLRQQLDPDAPGAIVFKHDPYCDCGICQYCRGDEDKFGNLTLTGEREEIMNFPLLIKQTRIALGETQAEFAERFATQANTVSRWESGQYQASYECLSFVVGYARDLVWSACPHCNGTGRVKSTLGKEAHKALNTKTS